MSDHLKYKIYDHEVVPPGNVWDAIQKELDVQSSFDLVANKIYSYEATPPSEAWNNIIATLDKDPDHTFASIRSILLRRLPRLTAIAAMVILLFAGIYYFSNSTGKSKNRTASSGNIIGSDQQRKLVADNSNNPRPPSNKIKTTLYSYNNGRLPRRQHDNVQERPLHHSYIEDADPLANQLIISVRPHPILNESGEPIQDMSVVNPLNKKYINITAPNGQQTRISSKLAVAMPYLGIIDPANQDQQPESNAWKYLIQEWRDKIMQSAFVPSSNNFLDILEFSDLLKE